MQGIGIKQGSLRAFGGVECGDIDFISVGNYTSLYKTIELFLQYLLQKFLYPICFAQNFVQNRDQFGIKSGINLRIKLGVFLFDPGGNPTPRAEGGFLLSGELDKVYQNWWGWLTPVTLQIG